MSVNKRIIAVCKARNIKQIDLVLDRLGSKQTVSNIMREVQKPNYKFTARLIESLPDLNARWLLTGQGEMFVNIDKNNITEKSNDNSYAERELEFKTKELELQKKETERLEKLIARYEKLLDQ